MKKLKIDIWSDFACPWCWIAKRRLEKAMAALDDGIEVEVANHASRLAPGMAPTDFRQALTRKFGSAERAKGLMQAIARSAAQESLTYRFDVMRFGDTSDAHGLVKSIAGESRRDRLIEALYRAGTTDGEDIYDREVLRRIALVTLPDVDPASLRFDHGAEIASDEAAGRKIASGIPLFAFNSTSFVSGAQPAETFHEAMTHAAGESPGRADHAAATCRI